MYYIIVFLFGGHFDKGFRIGGERSNEAALSLRSRRNGTKFAAPNGTAY